MTTFHSKYMSQSSKKIRLIIALFLHRRDWLTFALFTLLLSVGTAWWRGVPYVQKKIYRMEEMQTDLQTKRLQLKAIKQTPVPDDNLQRLNAFYGMLGEKKYIEQQVKTVLYLANEAGVVLKSGEYQLEENIAGKFHIYRMQLPLKGNYSQIRKFAEQVLLTIPFASLDEISFKREVISGTSIESKVMFSIYVNAEAKTPDRVFE